MVALTLWIFLGVAVRVAARHQVRRVGQSVAVVQSNGGIVNVDAKSLSEPNISVPPDCVDPTPMPTPLPTTPAPTPVPPTPAPPVPVRGPCAEIGLLLDASGSMLLKPKDGSKSSWENLQDFSYKVVNKLVAEGGNRMSVVVFGESALALSGLSNNADALREGIKNVDIPKRWAHADTLTFLGVKKENEVFDAGNVNKSLQQTYIVITDGLPTKDLLQHTINFFVKAKKERHVRMVLVAWGTAWKEPDLNGYTGNVKLAKHFFSKAASSPSDFIGAYPQEDEMLAKIVERVCAL